MLCHMIVSLGGKQHRQKTTALLTTSSSAWPTCFYTIMAELLLSRPSVLFKKKTWLLSSFFRHPYYWTQRSPGILCPVKSRCQTSKSSIRPLNQGNSTCMSCQLITWNAVNSSCPLTLSVGVFIDLLEHRTKLPHKVCTKYLPAPPTRYTFT